MAKPRNNKKVRRLYKPEALKDPQSAWGEYVKSQVGGNGGQGNGGGKGGNGGRGGAGAGTNMYDFSTPYGDPDTVKQLVKAMARTQFGPQLREAHRYQEQVPQFFNDYRNQIARLQGQQQQAYAQGLQQLGQFGLQQAAGTQGMFNAAQQLNPQGVNGQNATDMANAAAVRQGQVSNLGGLIQGQGLAQSNYMANTQAGSFPLQAQAQKAASEQVRGLQGDKGAFKLEALAQLREAFENRREADRNFRLVAKEFGLDKFQARVDAADTAADNRRDAQQNRADRRDERRENRRERREERGEVNEWGYTDAEWRRMSPERRHQIMKQVKNQDDDGGATGDDGSREERKETRKTISDIVGRADHYFSMTNEKDGEIVKPTPPQVRSQLLKDGFSSSEIAVAFAIRDNRKLTPREFRLAKQIGYPVPKRLRPIHVTKDPKFPNGPRPGVGGH